MSQDTNLIENEFADITPYDNYLLAFRDTETKRRYQGQLEMFINPRYQWGLPQQKRIPLSDEKLAVFVNAFVDLMKRDPNSGRNKIRRYVMKIKKEVEDKKLNANTSQNRLKPIKKMLRANDIDFSWYLIDKMMPKETKSMDRAYTRKEIQEKIPLERMICDIDCKMANIRQKVIDSSSGRFEYGISFLNEYLKSKNDDNRFLTFYDKIKISIPAKKRIDKVISEDKKNLWSRQN